VQIWIFTKNVTKKGSSARISRPWAQRLKSTRIFGFFPAMKPVFLYYTLSGVSSVSKSVSIKNSKYQKRLNFSLKVTIFGTVFQYYRYLSYSPWQARKISPLPKTCVRVKAEVRYMEPKDFEEAVSRAEELLRRETPNSGNIDRTYSKTMRVMFANVEKARADGFSFTQIREAFMEAWLLPRQAHSHSFRQAFYREAKRRDREKELLRRIKGDAGTSKKETIPEPLKANPADGLAERIKSQTSSRKETGLGTLIRYSDGSFDFDWK
jgi:hypothetical protein